MSTMEAIHCKKLTGKIKATRGEKSVYIPYPFELSGVDCYRAAAIKLVGANNIHKFIGGKLRTGEYVFVEKEN